MIIPLPAPSPFPALAHEGITMDEAMMTLALLLDGNACRDSHIIMDFCMTFGMSPEAVYREVFKRCLFPEVWTLH